VGHHRALPAGEAAQTAACHRTPRSRDPAAPRLRA
jgi:hypothetical protein